MTATSFGIGQYVASEGHVALTGRGYKRTVRRGVVFCHSNTQTGLSSISEASAGHLLKGLADHQFPVLSTDLGGTALFGNTTSQNRVGSAWTYVKTPWGAKTDKMLLFGISGGCPAALNYARANAGNVAAIALVLPMVNLQDAYDNRGFSAGMNTAYGGSWAGSAATHDPSATGNQAALAGIPIRAWHSSDDTTTLASVCETYKTAVNAVGGSMTTTSMGAVGHTSSALDPLEIVSFLTAYQA